VAPVDPNLRLLDASAIPPVVPNVIDIRIMNCPIKVWLRIRAIKR
jgi:hypothetical protein